MAVPRHAARIEQAHEPTRDRIQPGNVRAFVQVAQVAGESKVSQDRSPAVLTRDDVFDLERKDGGISLREQAILAARSGALPDELAQRPSRH